MTKALLVLIGLAALGIGVNFHAIENKIATFISADTAFGANGVSCNFSGSTSAGPNGYTKVTLSWNVTAGAKIYIGNGVNGATPVVGATTTTSVNNQEAFIKQTTTYLLIAGDGSSTSTCSFTASP